MSATVGAALKKVAVYLLKDKKALKFVGGAILVILIVILMPIIALLGLFSGTIDIDTDHLHEMIVQQQSVIMSSWYDVESAMREAGYDQQRIQEAQVLVTFALYNHASQNGFADKLVGCFAPEQTDAQLVSAVNNTFGTNIVAQDFTNAMASLRAAYIDYSGYTDPATKNNLDLVQWAIYAHSKGWGYVWGTYGQVLDKDLFEYKKTQYPEEVGGKAEFIEANWLGGRTADCVGFIKGYSWFEPSSGNIIYATNGMPDISADQMYNNATEKGTIDTIPEIPGLAVWHEGHIGIYIGGGEVIHASGTTKGVIKTPIGDSGWTHWLKIPYITYVEETADPTEPNEATTTPTQ